MFVEGRPVGGSKSNGIVEKDDQDDPQLTR